MKRQPYEEMTGIVDLDELVMMLEQRESLRTAYGEMQTAAHSTNNPLFEVYLDRISLAGKRLNGHIQSWYDRHALQYGAAPSELDNDGGDQ